jgi:uncharacterized membrane protein
LEKSSIAAILISLTVLISAVSFVTSAANANVNMNYPSQTSTLVQTIKSEDSGNPMVFPLLLLAALIILAAGIAIIFFSRRKEKHL